MRKDGQVQLRLITSRETRRWVIPKGWPMKGISPAKAAAREAYEEAGLLGTIAREALGIYSYEKRLAVRSVMCDVMVFPFKVKRQAPNWPERAQREGFWFTVASAANAVQEEDLKLLILSFGDIMARKWEEKHATSKISATSSSGMAKVKKSGFQKVRTQKS
ncbi:MAG: NUDIX hydrolase [Xanthobacter sp.]